MCPGPRCHRGRASFASGQKLSEVGLHQCPSERKGEGVPVRRLREPQVAWATYVKGKRIRTYVPLTDCRRSKPLARKPASEGQSGRFLYAGTVGPKIHFPPAGESPANLTFRPRRKAALHCAAHLSAKLSGTAASAQRTVSPAAMSPLMPAHVLTRFAGDDSSPPRPKGKYAGGRQVADAQECRRQAAECTRLSLTDISFQSETTMRGMARSWVALANQMDRLERL